MIGDAIAEFTPELTPEVKVEVVEAGDIKEMHSGGLVVLRYGVGLARPAPPGGT